MSRDKNYRQAILPNLTFAVTVTIAVISIVAHIETVII